MTKYFYETKYGSPEAAKVKAAGAKWNPLFKVWESDEPVEGVAEAKPNHLNVYHVHTEKTKQAYIMLDWMMSLNVDRKPIPEDKYQKCLSYFSGDSYEDACCRHALELYKELTDSGIQTTGFAIYPEEVLRIRE